MEAENKPIPINTSEPTPDQTGAKEAGIPEAEAGNTTVTETTNEVPDMEVHHHTHAPHGKKTWKIISGNS